MMRGGWSVAQPPEPLSPGISSGAASRAVTHLPGPRCSRKSSHVITLEQVDGQVRQAPLPLLAPRLHQVRVVSEVAVEQVDARQPVDVGHPQCRRCRPAVLSLIHISEPTRLGMISYAVF